MVKGIFFTLLITVLKHTSENEWDSKRAHALNVVNLKGNGNKIFYRLI